MKSKILLIITLVLLIFTLKSNGQALITKNDSISLGQDTVVQIIIPEYRGNIQWQKSLDSLNWTDLEGKTNDSLIIMFDTQAVYRAVITDGTCLPVFSDSAHVKFLVPEISTSIAMNITSNSARLGGIIINNGGQSISEQGICFSKNQIPTIADNKIVIDNNILSFDTIVSNLTSNSVYNVRAYAINNKGIVYGEPIEFTTGILTFSVSKTVIANNGDSIIAPNGTVLIVPENALASDGIVTLEISGNEPSEVPNQNLEVVGDVYTLTFPGDTLLNYIYLSFEKPAFTVSTDSYSLFLFNGNSYYPIEYTISGDTVTAIIDISDWESSQELNNKNVNLFSEILIYILVDKQTPPISAMGLKEVSVSDGSLIYSEPVADPNSKIVLFIHGWIGDSGTWDEMIFKIMEETDLAYSNIWTFGYNSSWGIEDNASLLALALSEYTNGIKVDIVAHSMGGLVSRAMIEYNNGTQFANKLIALGTPHLGSPLAALRDILGQFVKDENPSEYPFFNMITEGFRDLNENSVFIEKIKNMFYPPIPYYLIAATNFPFLWTPSNFLQGEDDGIVSVSSAYGVLGSTVSTAYHIPVKIAHTEMTRNDLIYQQVLIYLRSPNPVAPNVSTLSETNLSENSVTLNGNVTSDGNAVIIERGFYWSSTDNSPDSNDNVEPVSGSTGIFNKILTGLESNKTYYFRAFATNSKGTSTGETLQFTTNQELSAPVIITNSATNVITDGGTLNGNVTSDGNSTITGRGFYWSSTDNSPDSNDIVEPVSGSTGNFNKILTGLESNKTYYFRAFATNGEGTSTGETLQFTTNQELSVATVTITSVGGTTYTGANVTGNVTSDGGAAVTARGICWNTTGSPSLENGEHTSNGTGTGTFIGELTGLQSGTLYYIRSYAINSQGTAYSQQFDFNTTDLPAISISSVSPPEATLGVETTFTVSGSGLVDGMAYYLADLEGTEEVAGGTATTRQFKGIPSNTIGIKDGVIKDAPDGNILKEFQVTFIQGQTKPSVTTSSISSITETSATCGGNVTSDGGATVTARGVCWNTTGSPTTTDLKTVDGSGIGVFTSQLTNLIASTTYYVRAYATNSVDTEYGEQVSFTTESSGGEIVYGSFTDSRDGKTYKTVQIGEQIWMAENLAYNVEDGCWAYDNDESNVAIYGRLYDWNTALAACPSGWHLPTDDEWKQLEMVIGMSQSEADLTGWRGINEGTKLKAISGWDNNGNGTNDYGFSSLPGGYRISEGNFYGIGTNSYWWSSTEGSTYGVWRRYLGYNYARVGRATGSNTYGYAVRLVRD